VLVAELYEVGPLEGGLAERRTPLLPVMFCRKIRGILRWQQSSMKWVPLRADSANRTPLFPIIPTGYPYRREKPKIHQMQVHATFWSDATPYTPRFKNTCTLYMYVYLTILTNLDADPHNFAGSGTETGLYPVLHWDLPDKDIPTNIHIFELFLSSVAILTGYGTGIFNRENIK